MKLFLPSLLLFFVLLSASGNVPRSKCKAYATFHYISEKDTLNFIGESRFEIAAHSRGRDKTLTGVYTVTDGLIELTFDMPKGEEIPAKANYTYVRHGIRYVEKGSAGFYGYKRQLFRAVYETGMRR